MTNNKKILEIYKKTGALLSGHFILSSGLHSEIYLQSALVLSIPKYLKIISNALSIEIKKVIDEELIDLIVSPAMGAVVIGSKIGEELNKKAIFLERVNKNFSLRRGFQIPKKTRVLIIEDVITTGKSSAECIDCVESFGGKVLGLASIVDRSEKDLNLGVDMISLLKIHAPTYSHNNLPKKLENIPIDKPGSRFLV